MPTQIRIRLKTICLASIPWFVLGAVIVFLVLMASVSLKQPAAPSWIPACGSSCLP